MRAFQLIIAVITALMTTGMFAFNMWISSNFSKGTAIPECYKPMNIITTALVLITIITIFLRK